jgi:FKBP-type peptidyl-prolyl cis-trans isomerase
MAHLLSKWQRFLKETPQEGVKTTPPVFNTRCSAKARKTPTATDVVAVNYRGTLINGKEFDSSYKAGQPIEFPLNRVIPGWTEGVQLMKEGAKYEFFIPSNLAYGPRGAGGVIGPDETLIFEVELLKVK